MSIVIFSCSEEYDDSAIWAEINSIKSNIDKINQDLNVLHDVVTALQNNDYVTKVEQTGNGYTLFFSSGKNVSINNGEDGDTPLISIKKDTDGNSTDSIMNTGNKDNSDKLLFWSRVTGISSLLAFLCILAVTVALLSFMPQIGDMVSNFEEISMELKDMSTEITRVLRSLNEQGLSEIYGTLDNIQKIDIEKLNESIDSLHRIIEPFASLFS